jgi:ADP-ribose pyrophosphatase YjhB (NUDIX family)
LARVQAIVSRGDRVLMVRHRHGEEEWWCLPGGALDPGEAPRDGALRELAEECNVGGTVVRRTSHLTYGPEDETYTFLVEIGDQRPSLGHDPDVAEREEVLAEVRWMHLREVPERDRAFLWAAGLLGVGDFWVEVERWGDDPSYPCGGRHGGQDGPAS